MLPCSVNRGVWYHTMVLMVLDPLSVPGKRVPMVPVSSSKSVPEQSCNRYFLCLLGLAGGVGNQQRPKHSKKCLPE